MFGFLIGGKCSLSLQLSSLVQGNIFRFIFLNPHQSYRKRPKLSLCVMIYLQFEIKLLLIIVFHIYRYEMAGRANYNVQKNWETKARVKQFSERK